METLRKDGADIGKLLLIEYCFLNVKLLVAFLAVRSFVLIFQQVCRTLRDKAVDNSGQQQHNQQWQTVE